MNLNLKGYPSTPETGKEYRDVCDCEDESIENNMLAMLQFTLDKIQEAFDRDITMEQLRKEVESDLHTYI